MVADCYVNVEMKKTVKDKRACQSDCGSLLQHCTNTYDIQELAEMAALAHFKVETEKHNSCNRRTAATVAVTAIYSQSMCEPRCEIS